MDRRIRQKASAFLISAAVLGGFGISSAAAHAAEPIDPVAIESQENDSTQVIVEEAKRVPGVFLLHESHFVQALALRSSLSEEPDYGNRAVASFQTFNYHKPITDFAVHRPALPVGVRMDTSGGLVAAPKDILLSRRSDVFYVRPQARYSWGDIGDFMTGAFSGAISSPTSDLSSFFYSHLTTEIAMGASF